MTPEQTERAIERARLRGVAEADLAAIRTALLEAHRREETKEQECRTTPLT